MIKIITYSNGNKAEIVLTREDCINKVFKPILAGIKDDMVCCKAYIHISNNINVGSGPLKITFPLSADKATIDLELKVYDQIKNIQNDKWWKLLICLLLVSFGGIISCFVGDYFS